MATKIRGLIVFLSCLALGGAVLESVVGAQAHVTAPASFACPMHPDVRSATPGTCPRCGMKLVAGGTVLNDRYLLDLSIEPRAPRATMPVALRFRVRQGDGESTVRDFLEVHERIFHLFVVSDDLAYFDHIHPQLSADGSLSVTTRLPRDGRYQLYADFVPQGGTPQFIARTVFTAGAFVDPAAKRATLAPDIGPQRTAHSIVELQLPSGYGLVSGELQAFRLHLRDLTSGADVHDLEPFLGAPAHLLIVSEDLVDALHSHPSLEFSSATGPDVVFETVFPRAGLYRMWVQFQRHGQLALAAFTVPVTLPPSR